MVKINRSNSDATFEREFPEPPFTQHDYDSMKIEIAGMEKIYTGAISTIRDLWIAKNGGGRIDPKYGLEVKTHEYKKLSEKWNKFTEWSARREFGEREKLKQLEASSFNI